MMPNDLNFQTVIPEFIPLQAWKTFDSSHMPESSSQVCVILSDSCTFLSSLVLPRTAGFSVLFRDKYILTRHLLFLSLLSVLSLSYFSTSPQSQLMTSYQHLPCFSKATPLPLDCMLFLNSFQTHFLFLPCPSVSSYFYRQIFIRLRGQTYQSF